MGKIKLTYIEHLTQQQQLLERLYSGPKTNLKKVSLEIIQKMLSNHNGIKVEISERKIIGKSLEPWKLNNTI